MKIEEAKYAKSKEDNSIYELKKNSDGTFNLKDISDELPREDGFPIKPSMDLTSVTREDLCKNYLVQ